MVVAVSTGSHHTCAIQANSRLLHCWGLDEGGQVSGKPLDLGTVATVAVGRSHTCAVHANSSLLRCWGSSGPKVLGQPPDLGAVAAVAAGTYHTCAIQANSSLRCCGENYFGQASMPQDLGMVVAVSAGTFHTCAIQASNGVLRCGGEDPFGQVSGQPPNLGAVVVVAAGYDHTYAIQASNGTLRCWGDDSYGKTSLLQNLSTIFRGGGDTCDAFECNSPRFVGVVPIAQNVLRAASPCLPEDTAFCCVSKADCSLFASRQQFCASYELVDSANLIYCHGPSVDDCTPTECCKRVCATPPCVCLLCLSA